MKGQIYRIAAFANSQDDRAMNESAERFISGKGRHTFICLFLGTWCSLKERERERERQRAGKSFFQFVDSAVTVRYLQAAVQGWGAPAAEQHVCKYLLQQHEA